MLRLCKKQLDIKKAGDVIRAAKAMGFLVYGFFVIGLPGETEEAFRATMDFAQRMDFDVANFCMAIPFVGTELYRMVETGGRFLIDTTRNIDDGFYSGRVFFTIGNLTEHDVLRRYHAAYREFYSLPRKLKLLTKIRSWPELCWHFNAAAFVLKGMLRSKLRR